jgi:putative hydrolases of HD superfamily
MLKIIDFIIELDKLKTVTRKTRVLHEDRYENSAEHSWQIAMLAASLTSYAVEPIDINRVIGMLLVHDIGEIDTGDTIVYAEEGLAEPKVAEKQAVTRIFSLLPIEEADKFMSLWQEFEDGQTAEARFAHAADRAMPVLLNLANNGQSWVENGISYQRVINKIAAPIEAGCPALWAHISNRLEAENARGWYGMQIAFSEGG